MTNYTLPGVKLPDDRVTDLYVVDGVLADDAGPGSIRLDTEGLRVLPGLVDLHTHLREPGRQDAETVDSGTQAAAKGGFTAVFAMPNTFPVTDTEQRAEHIQQLGQRAGHAAVIPVGAITKSLAGQELAELGLMHRSHAQVTMFSDDGHCLMDPVLMRRAFEWVKPFGGVLAQHSQDSSLAGPNACCHEGEISGKLGLPGWPPVAESAIIARDAQLAEAVGGKLHVCHITSAEGVDVVRWAKRRGIEITAEVTPHHLLLTADELTGYDTTYKVNPPLRTNEHVEALRAALADGTIDVVATDHAPHAPQDKDHAFIDARPGMLGLEQALAVVIEVMIDHDRLSWDEVAQRMSRRPAQIGQLRGHGGYLKPGEPAHLVVVNPTRRGIVNRDDSASLSRNNPYHGRELPDPVELTMLDGTITYHR